MGTVRCAPDDVLVLFVDRALGAEDVPTALREAGATVEVMDDHFPDVSDDSEWIVAVTQRGWVILTKDKRIRRNRLERLGSRRGGVKKR